MELKEFVATHVSAGQPLTAQAWNDIVDAVDDLHQFIVASLFAVHVKITTPGIALANVRVTAQRGSDPPVEAVRPVAPDDRHALVGLNPGAYTVRAEAPGFAVATATVNVGDTQDVAVDLALSTNGALMPNLFGLALTAARTQLGAASISISRLLDFNGDELPPQNPGSAYEAALVLVQNPSAGTPVPPGQSVQIVLAVPVRLDTNVEVPSLAGMTLVEAQKALEGLGLTLGKVRTVVRRTI
jgi:hypothetical protein